MNDAKATSYGHVAQEEDVETTGNVRQPTKFGTVEPASNGGVGSCWKILALLLSAAFGAACTYAICALALTTSPATGVGSVNPAPTIPTSSVGAALTVTTSPTIVAALTFTTSPTTVAAPTIITSSTTIAGPSDVPVHVLDPKGNPQLTAVALDSIKALTDDDERRIDTLFMQHHCEHVFLDVGANIGVQTRKLFEPHLFPASKFLPVFDKYFGQAPRCRVCAIAIEPNPVHRTKLHMVRDNLTQAGAGVVIFEAAATAMDGRVEFHLNKGEQVKEHWGASMAMIPEKQKDPSNYVVRALDLTRLVQYVDKKLQESAGEGRPRGNIVMKLDVETGEFMLIPPMIMTSTICKLTCIQFEWHVMWVCPKMAKRCVWRKGWASGEATNFMRALEQAKKEMPCPVTLINTDDESYLHGISKWPNSSVCEPSHKR